MPFLGRDWRSPGEYWIKTENGWEPCRLLEYMIGSLDQGLKGNVHCCPKSNRSTLTTRNVENIPPQLNNRPPILYTRTSRENCQKPCLTDALNRLDFAGAVRDIRKFNYVCTLVQLLIREKLRELSGATQRSLFNIVQQLVTEALSNHQNVNALQWLLRECRKALRGGLYDLFFIGSSSVWEKQVAQLEAWQNQLAAVQPRSRPPDGKALLSDLPEECQRAILAKLDSGADLVRIGMANAQLYRISQELALWRELCMYHFDGNQLSVAVSPDPDEADWKNMYFRLQRRYGNKEVFPNMIHQCCCCSALFWMEDCHPCVQEDYQSKPISPRKLIDLLS